MEPRPLQITRETLVAQKGGAVSSIVEGEAVILDIDSGYFFQLNAVASRIWEALQSEMTISSLCDQLHTQFVADPEVCTGDVLEFLNEMSLRGLISVK